MGRNQHTLPQFLLRGFASRVRNKREKPEHYIWRFPRVGEPHETNIRNVAAERDFYGAPGEAEVDAKLARDDEPRFSVLVEQLRACPGEVPEELALLVPAFIVHIETRTRHWRETFTRDSEATLTFFNESLQDVVARWSQPAGRLVSSYIERTMRVEAAKQRGQTRASQLAALAARPEDHPRTAHLNPLRWCVVGVSERSLILGDLGVVVRFRGARMIQSPFVNEKIEALFLPLTHSRVLVGYPNDVPSPPIDTDELNAASAELSYEFFGASCEARKRAHMGRIAARVALFNVETMRAHLRVIEARRDSDRRKGSAT